MTIAPIIVRAKAELHSVPVPFRSGSWNMADAPLKSDNKLRARLHSLNPLKFVVCFSITTHFKDSGSASLVIRVSICKAVFSENTAVSEYVD